MSDYAAEFAAWAVLLERLLRDKQGNPVVAQRADPDVEYDAFHDYQGRHEDRSS
jgi:hypothetical protein